MAKLPKNKQNHVFAMAQRRARVATLYLAGKTQQQIAAEVGVSQMTVSTDLAALRKAWLASSLRDFDTMKAEELARLELLEREAWEAWSRSKQDAETIHKEPMLSVRGECPCGELQSAGEGADLIPVAVKFERTVSGQPGDPRYLVQVLRCIEARLKMLGVLDGSPVQMNTVVLNWDALGGRPNGTDPSDCEKDGNSLRVARTAPAPHFPAKRS